MMRKFAKLAVLFFMLMCLMGAGTVTFDAGQPNPNPGGLLQVLEGKGTYGPGQMETVGRVDMEVKETTTLTNSAKQANLKAGKWDCTINLVKGTYDVWATIETVDNKGVIITKSCLPVKGVVVK